MQITKLTETVSICFVGNNDFRKRNHYQEASRDQLGLGSSIVADTREPNSFSTGYHKPMSGRRLQRKANATKKISEARVCDVVYHACMFQKIIAVLAWALLAFIVFATMAPLKDRPTLFSSAALEHIGAFAILGGLFCLAYPRHIILVCFIVLGSAVLLECLQTLTLDRHGTLLDATEKIVGGAFSIFAARAALYLRHRKRSSQSQI